MESSAGTTPYGALLKVPPLNLVFLSQGRFQSRPFGEGAVDHKICGDITGPAPAPAPPLPGVSAKALPGGMGPTCSQLSLT